MSNPAEFLKTVLGRSVICKLNKYVRFSLYFCLLGQRLS